MGRMPPSNHENDRQIREDHEDWRENQLLKFPCLVQNATNSASRENIFQGYFNFRRTSHHHQRKNPKTTVFRMQEVYPEIGGTRGSGAARTPLLQIRSLKRLAGNHLVHLTGINVC